MIAAAAESIVMNKDANFLCKNGGIKLTKDRRMGKILVILRK